jgi:hypothetical protein
LPEQRYEGLVEGVVTLFWVWEAFPPLDGFNGVLGFFESDSSALPIELDRLDLLTLTQERMNLLLPILKSLSRAEGLRNRRPAVRA